MNAVEDRSMHATAVAATRFSPLLHPRANRVMMLDVLSETAANSAAVVFQDARYQHAPFVQPPGAPGWHWEKSMYRWVLQPKINATRPNCVSSGSI